MKRKMTKAAVTIIIILSAMPVFAETIVLKSGKTIKGKIFERTDQYLKINFQGLPLTFYLDEIESIKSDKISSQEADSATSQAIKVGEHGAPPDNRSPRAGVARQGPKPPFYTAIITYKYGGEKSGTKTIYIDMPRDRFAEESIVADLSATSKSVQKKVIYVGNALYVINPETNGATKREWKKGIILLSFGNENALSKYYANDATLLGKKCKVYRTPTGNFYYWQGILLKSEVQNNPKEQQFNFIQEAVDIKLDVAITLDKFKLPQNIKFMTVIEETKKGPAEKKQSNKEDANKNR